MAEEGGISDYAIINQTAKEARATSNPASPGGGAAGFQSAGFKLGDALTGGGASAMAGQTAYNRGLQVGASTIDALAQARERINTNNANAKAAAQLRDPQFQATLGLQPQEGEYAATLAEKGAPPAQVSSFLKEMQSIRNRKLIGDATAPQANREAAAASEDPAMLTPHAVGTAGAVLHPATQTPQGSGAVSMTPDQTALTRSEINQHNAGAAASNALADQRDNNPTGGKGGLRTGFRWKMDPDNPGQIMTDAGGTPIQEANPNAGGEGAIQQRYTARMVNASNGLAKETANLAKLGFTASSGAQIPGAAHPGVMGTIFENAGKKLSDENSQMYSSSMANVDRQLGLLELAGGVPTGTYTGALRDAVKNQPGDTEGNRLYHAAIIRQIAEQAAETVNSGNARQESKDAVNTAVGKIQKSVPFTPGEIIDFRREGKPGQTLQSYLDSRPREPVEHFGREGVTPTGSAPTNASSSDPLGILKK